MNPIPSTHPANLLRSACLLALLSGSLCTIANAQSVVRESVNSASNGGDAGNGDSQEPAIAGNANRLVFRTAATNFVTGAAPGGSSSLIVRKDRASGSLIMLNGSGQTASPPLSGEFPSGGTSSVPTYKGSGAAWMNNSDQAAPQFGCADSNNNRDIYFNTGTPSPFTAISSGGGCPTQFDNDSTNPDITPDNVFLAFESTATNIPGDGNAFSDIYWSPTTGTRTFSKLSVKGNILSGVTAANGASNKPSTGGSEADASYVIAFESIATNLGGTTDTLGHRDIFARIVPAGGGLSFPSTIRVSRTVSSGETNGASFDPHVSKTGRYIAYSSDATNIVSGDTNNQRDIFLFDRSTGDTKRISVSLSGAQANGACNRPRVNADGTWVAFESTATNLIPGFSPPAGRSEIYLCHVPSGTIFICSYDYATNNPPDNNSNWASISDDGRTVAFHSDATNIIDFDVNAKRDVFTYSRSAAPANDNCANAIPISNTLGGPSIVLGSLSGAFPTPGLINPCGSSAFSPDVWYAYTPVCSGPYRFQTSGFDTVLALYDTCGGTALFCDDDGGTNQGSQINTTLVEGQTILVRVSGFANRSGDFTLGIQPLGIPANDSCFNAGPAPLGTITFPTCLTTNDGPALNPPVNDLPIGADVWHTFSPPYTARYNLNTNGSNFDTMIAVYLAASCPVTTVQQVAADDDSGVGNASSTSLVMIGGASYKIRVGGFQGAVGQAVLTIRVAGCSPADIAFDTGDALPPFNINPPGVNNGVTEGDYNLFFSGYFDALAYCDIADDQGTALAPFGNPVGANNGVTEGDYNCFFSIYFDGCP
ncbi:MAG: hypothetical protein K2X32_07980 [Phycisphaerales bacterium]|nr:hypothetical protein [Phycisphaerales bacterium]